MKKPLWQPRPQDHQDHKGDGGKLLVITMQTPWRQARPQDHQDQKGNGE
jgi:hypothetical protein